MIAFFKKLLGATSVDYRELVKNGAIIVDVRTPGEYRTGHIKGSKNFPLDSIRSKVTELKKSGKPVITVCRSGSRSGFAKSILRSSGIEVYNGGPWTSLQNKI